MLLLTMLLLTMALRVEQVGNTLPLPLFLTLTLTLTLTPTLTPTLTLTSVVAAVKSYYEAAPLAGMILANLNP